MKESQSATEIVRAGLKRRYQAEKRFRFFGIVAIVISLLFLVILFADILGKGLPAFRQPHIRLSVFFDPAELSLETLDDANYHGIIEKS